MPKGIYKRLSAEDRFYKYVNKLENGCWMWTGCEVRRYGAFQLNGKLVKSHRLMWEMMFGTIPEGMCVCNACDTPLCVNPEHLFLGDHKDNAEDRESKGRGNHQLGEKSGRAKLTNEQARDMRLLRIKSGMSYKKLGERFGVSTMQAFDCVKRKSYKEA